MDARELEVLLKPAEMSEAEKELRQWLQKCKQILDDRDAYEVAGMAILAGFDKNVVYHTLSTFHDAMNGSHIDQRAAYWPIMQVGRIQNSRERFLKWKFLNPLWDDYLVNFVGPETVENRKPYESFQGDL